MKFIFLHADKHWSLLQGDTIVLSECNHSIQNQSMPKVPKRSVHIFAISP